MSFEIQYFYHPKKDGKYDTGSTLEMTKKLGSLFDDISYEKLAATIMGQLARRDIMVVDVSVYEYVKKKIAFKESSTGVIIKGKKYSYGDSSEQLIVETVEPMPNNPSVSTPQAPVSQHVPTPSVPSVKPLRFEIFEPHPDFIRGAKKYAFTVGRDYPIYEEKADSRGNAFGMVYTTTDDKGNKQVMPDKYFVPKVNLGGFGSSNTVDLFNGAGGSEGMINIRGGR